MKKIHTFFTLFGSILTISLNSFGADATVTMNGNWTSTSTWLGSAIPSSTLDSLKFETSDLTLNVDTNATVGAIKLTDNSSQAINSNISIATGNTLTLNGISGNMFTSTSSSKISFSGEGTLKFGSTWGTFTGGVYTFDTNVTTGSYGITANGNAATININKTWETKASFTLANSSVINVGGIANFDRLNAWSSSSTFNMLAGSTMNIKYGMAMTKGNINGTINAKGYVTAGSSEENYNMTFGRRDDGSRASIIFGDSSQITWTRSSNPSTNELSSTSMIRNCDLTVNSKAGGFKTDSKILLTKTSITMNTSDVFYSNSATSQAQSVFIVGERKYANPIAASNATLNINAKNDFGTFEFVKTDNGSTVANSYITMDVSRATPAGGLYVSIGALQLYENNQSTLDAGFAYLKLDGLLDFTVKIGDISNLNIVDIDPENNIYSTSNIQYKDGAEYKDVYLVFDGQDSFWINTSTIPEPSTLAAILGVLAISLVVYRRK